MSFLLVVSGGILFSLAVLSCGSLLNLSSSPHWFVRGWDFPRVQIVLLGFAFVLMYAVIRLVSGPSNVVSPWPILLSAGFLAIWHGIHIFPYTVFYPRQSVATPESLLHNRGKSELNLRMVVTNVEMENDQYETWAKEMRKADPDLLLVVEIDDHWVRETKELRKEYSHEIVEAQDNWYGMMLLSRRPIAGFKVRYLVQDDVPSMDVHIRLDDRTTFRVIGVHPRPPEPLRGNDATARDAELVLWGQELEKESGPVIIGGDLNDVAWSKSTRLFLRTSGLLDPRRGRGFFNTFNAKIWCLRFPLDHIFHSEHFTVTRIERLSYVGSDHFPILIDLRFSPAMRESHNVLENKASDRAEMDLRLQRAVREDEFQGDAVNKGSSNEIADLKDDAAIE